MFVPILFLLLSPFLSGIIFKTGQKKKKDKKKTTQSFSFNQSPPKEHV